VTFTASWHKMFDPNPRVGFLAQAEALAAGPATGATARLIFNNRLDAAVTGVLIVMVTLVLVESMKMEVPVTAPADGVVVELRGVVPSDAFATRPTPIEAVRVCLGGPIGRDQLRTALGELNHLLSGSPDFAALVI